MKASSNDEAEDLRERESIGGVIEVSCITSRCSGKTLWSEDAVVRFTEGNSICDFAVGQRFVIEGGRKKAVCVFFVSPRFSRSHRIL